MRKQQQGRFISRYFAAARWGHLLQCMLWDIEASVLFYVQNVHQVNLAAPAAPTAAVLAAAAAVLVVVVSKEGEIVVVVVLVEQQQMHLEQHVAASVWGSDLLQQVELQQQ